MLKSDYSDESWSLDAGTYYDEYKWFLNDALIGSEKTINIDHSEMDPINDNEVKLISTFRGYNFIESSKILSVSASIKDFSSEKISVTYINNIIQIKLIALSEITNVNIYKLNGQYLNSFIIEPGQNFYELNTNQWDRGIYVLRIDLDDKYIIKKILVF